MVKFHWLSGVGPRAHKAEHAGLALTAERGAAQRILLAGPSVRLVPVCAPPASRPEKGQTRSARSAGRHSDIRRQTKGAHATSKRFGSPDRPLAVSAMARRCSPTQLPLGDVDMGTYGFGDEASRKVRWVGPRGEDVLPLVSAPCGLRSSVWPPPLLLSATVAGACAEGTSTFQPTTYRLLIAAVTAMRRILCPARLPTMPIIPSAIR